MSIYSALNVGVNGVNSQSNRIGVISDNIANVNTTGYSSSNATFADLIQYSNSPVTYSPSGAKGGSKLMNDASGTVTPTNAADNLAISGNGFFAVSDTSAAAGSIVYTRAGNFSPDANGDFVNSNGFYLKAWKLDANGNLPTALNTNEVDASSAIAGLTTVNPSAIIEIPVATTTVSTIAALPASQTAYPATAPGYNPADPLHNMASGTITPQYTTTQTITDSMSVTHNVTTSYLKTSATTYAVEVYANPTSDTTATGGQIAAGTLTVDSTGALISVSPSLSSITATWTDGATPSPVPENWTTAATTLSQQSLSVAYNPNSSGADMASGAITPQQNIPVNVFDANGVSHTLTIGFLKTAPNTWAVEVYSKAGDTTGTTAPQLAAGTLTFNGDGTLASISPALSAVVPATWSATGTAPGNITFDWGTPGVAFGTTGATVIGRADGVSQTDTAFSQSTAVNGHEGGGFNSIAFTSDGYIVGNRTDGTSENLYKIPVVTFADPDQLAAKDGDVFALSTNSTPPIFRQPDENGAGAIEDSAVNASNVDLSSELTNMIIAQRSYQFNTKIISTTDTMLQTLNSMGVT